MCRVKPAKPLRADIRKRNLSTKVNLGRQAAKVPVHHVRPLTARELIARLTKLEDDVAFAPCNRGALRNIFDHAEHTDDGRRQNRGATGLVVERHIAAGDRDIEFEATIGQTARGFGELPHHFGVFWGTEVQTIRHGERNCSGDTHIAIGLGECEFCAVVRVKFCEATIAVSRHSDSATSDFINTDHAGVFWLCKHGVAEHVTVILIGDPTL